MSRFPKPRFDFTTLDGLRSDRAKAESFLYAEWVPPLTDLLRRVEAAAEKERANPEFQKEVWTSTAVSDGGSVRDEAITGFLDTEFCAWFASETVRRLPDTPEERTAALASLVERVLARIEDRWQYDWKPWVESLGTLAAFFPNDFTAIANPDDLLNFARKGLGLEIVGKKPVEASRLVLDRFEEAFGAPESSLEGRAERMLLVYAFSQAWHHYDERDPSIWMVRAGKNGEDEEYVLSHDMAMLGFTEHPAPETDTLAEYRVRVRKDTGRSSHKVGATAGQVWSFAHDILEGDIIVLPRKRDDKRVHWGRVDGDYEHRVVRGQRRHTRPVRWERRDLARDSLREYAGVLNARGTVKRFAAADARNLRPVLYGDSRGLTPLPLEARHVLIPFAQEDEIGWLCWMVGLIGDGISLGDLRARISEKHPGWKAGAIAVKIHTATTQLQCLKKGTDLVEVTDAGRRLLATRDPDALMERLLTGIVGVDHVLVFLEAEAKAKGEALSMLGRLRPKWTQPDAVGPGDVVLFLKRAGVVEEDDEKVLRLTDRGRRWRGAIHWVPAGPQPQHLPLRKLWEPLDTNAEADALRFDRSLVEALHLGLWADTQRHFAVLSGLSGTGKTQIALRYAMALTGAESDTGGPVEVISVHPGWHDPGPLLGYVNPLTGNYTRTEFLNFLLDAEKNPGQPHVLVLDEMNLSHPEQYFAPILSAMEIRNGEIPLHREDPKKLGVPTGVAYPSNLVIIGTVNMDETTMGISDKVLDRAFTLEFWDIAPEEWPGWDGCALDPTEKSKVRRILTELTDALSPARRHFGWRVIKEVVGFLEGRSQDSGIELAAEAALDQVIYAKVLPKLRGSDTGRFRNCLDATLSVLDEHGLTRCTEKVKALKEDLEATGSCSFWR